MCPLTSWPQFVSIHMRIVRWYARNTVQKICYRFKDSFHGMIYSFCTCLFLFYTHRTIWHDLRYKAFKGTNCRQKTYEIFHVYCIFYSGFMCQTTIIFGITKDGSLESNILASWIVSLAETSFKMALTICQNV